MALAQTKIGKQSEKSKHAVKLHAALSVKLMQRSGLK